ncbi:helix-turn-helix transcriptional regulator [Thermaurantiacus sp.]
MSKRQTVGAGVERLTEKQRQCLRLTYQHMTSKEIAPLLGLSPHSVDAHIRIAMKVLGVDSRREAARILYEIEAAKPARRKSVSIQYDNGEVPTHTHVSESPAPAWTYFSVGSNMEAFQKDSRHNSAMEAPVEQSGSTGDVFEPVSNGRDYRFRLWTNPTDYTVRNKILIVLLTALLSAMAFTTISSGFAAMSLLVSGGDGAR